MGKGSRTVKGKHNAAKTNKNEQKRPNIEEKLIEFSSDAGGSASDSNNAKTSRQVAKRPLPGIAAKRQRTTGQDAMEEDFASSSTSPKNSSISSEISPTSRDDNNTQPQQGVVTPNSANQSNTNQEIIPRSEVSRKGKEIDTGMEVDPTSNKETDGTTPPDNNDNASRHANPSDEVMDEDDDVDSLDVLKLKAAVPFDDVIKEKETKKQLINRITDVMLDNFTSIVKVTIIKKGINTARLVVVILTDKAQHKEIIEKIWTELRPAENRDPPLFHNFDPAAILELERLRSLNIKNIPLRITKQNLETYFKKFGLIDQVRLYVPHNSLFQSAVVVYRDAAVVDPFMRSRWGMFIMGECVRIYPARLSPAEHSHRNAFTAVLRNLPRRIQATDLMRLFSSIRAAAMGLPRTQNETTKPWAYFNFTSEESMQAAIEAAPTLSGRQLVWATPDDVRLFCPKCSSPEHKAKDCNDMQFRGRKPTPKALISTYKKHGIVTAATKQADQDNRNNAKKTTSRSRNCSVSRNRSDNSSGPSKSVSYADAAKGTNLDSSIHAPTNPSQGKNKNQLNNISPDIINTLLATVQ